MNEVDAVKSRAEIAAIETLLRKHHGNLYADIWKIGLNLSLRISDLLAIRFADLDLDRRAHPCRSRHRSSGKSAWLCAAKQSSGIGGSSRRLEKPGPGRVILAMAFYNFRLQLQAVFSNHQCPMEGENCGGLQDNSRSRDFSATLYK